MAAQTTSLNLKISKDERDRFAAISESLGMTSSAALKVLVHAFNEAGGFPFELRARRVNFDNPMILRTKVKDGVIVMPDEWRDDDDDD